MRTLNYHPIIASSALMQVAEERHVHADGQALTSTCYGEQTALQLRCISEGTAGKSDPPCEAWEQWGVVSTKHSDPQESAGFDLIQGQALVKLAKTPAPFNTCGRLCEEELRLLGLVEFWFLDL
jgi:hypothetical protein